MSNGKKPKTTQSICYGRGFAHTYTHRGSARATSEISTYIGASGTIESDNRRMYADCGNVPDMSRCRSRHFTRDAGEQRTIENGDGSEIRVLPPFELGGES